jgi:hypothetical protein
MLGDCVVNLDLLLCHCNRLLQWQLDRLKCLSMRCLSSAETKSLAHADAIDPLIAPAIAHREAGRYAEAAAWLTEYLISHPDDARALAHLAHARLLCREDAAAHTALARAETPAPDSLLVLRNRARLARD